ncbi:copper resistance protein NlpE N-terminal domain-containing protein [Dyadobacter sp. CY261]|uniref:copper resistance protein NlpE N-terminal domain-containing protein n=1 Tax=Dyadobacter sp. CY261 TaxID=2907203 RepID=UPI001F197E91|nr:copper resistance protein NlpE N-terminal domain-containing protein [Dyadobacter sp. CY261]MCF0071167.1 copper resistance protein NlpE N-terminal domain-containing protein [Dyadobacter sp. CY261]
MKTLFLLAACFLSLQKAAAQSAAPANIPSKTTTRQPVAEGPNVWGVFHGRVPCQPIAQVIHMAVGANCEKLKWGFTFYQDPQTQKPARYRWDGSLFRDKPRTGNWALVRGTADDPDATVIQLDPDQPEKSIYLLKGDENVLFILDGAKKPMVGGDYLSYTFNRVKN